MAYQTTYGPDGRLRVAILGCTGSIGAQALDVCRQHADRLQVTALSVNSSTSELVAAAREFSVPAVAVADASHGADAVLQELPEGTELGVGAQAVCELACRDDVDCVLNYDIPEENEYYIHRIGRTGRAKRHGVAYTLVADYPSKMRLDAIAKFTGNDVKPAHFEGDTLVVDAK